MNCRSCAYFYEGDGWEDYRLRCAVNPVAVTDYDPDRPNDCNDFFSASQQSSSTDISLNQAQFELAQQRQQLDTYQRQLVSSSEQIAQLRSEARQVQSEIHRLSIQLHQLKCEQIELENKLSEIGSKRQIAQQEPQKQLEHSQCFTSESESDIDSQIEKARKLMLMESGEIILVVSIAFSMIVLSFNHRLMASCAVAFGFGATALGYGYALYSRKPH